MQAPLKRTKVELELFTDIDMLLTAEKGIRRGICHSNNRCTDANNKYMKDYDKNKESSYLKYWDINNLYGWAMLQKLAVDFEWEKKAGMKKVMKDIFLKLMFNILNNCINFIMIYHF